MIILTMIIFLMSPGGETVVASQNIDCFLMLINQLNVFIFQFCTNLSLLDLFFLFLQ